MEIWGQREEKWVKDRSFVSREKRNGGKRGREWMQEGGLGRARMGRGAEAAAARRQPPLCLEPRTVHWPSLKGVRRPPHHSRRRPQPRDRCTSSRRHRRRLRFCFLFETKRGGDAQRQQGGGAHSSQGIGKCVSSFRRLFLLAFCVYTCVSSSNYCVRINGCFRPSDEPRITERGYALVTIRGAREEGFVAKINAVSVNENI